jgi:hypothetical protein
MTQNKDIGGLHVAPVGMRHINKTDSIVDSVIDKFIERAEMGKEKYGTDLDRTDLELIDFINHALEEHMDAILYLQKVKKMLETKGL